MIKPCNLISLLDAKNSLDDASLQKYFNYFGIEIAINGCKNGIKKSELDDIEIFCKKLKRSNSIKINFFDDFYVGYHIPQIGKEFDLLRIGENYLINIEIKSQADSEKVQEQLLNNKYYLSFLEKPMYLYSYVVSTDSFYFLTEIDEIKKVSLDDIVEKVFLQRMLTIENIDYLFKPSHYLVSPFNSTDKFMGNEYFLTNQQTEIKEKILRLEENPNTHFIALTGAAGTGKTLLVYDIAKHLIDKDKKILVLHCAKLNAGQNLLVEQYGWNINSTRYAIDSDFSSFDFIIVDEAQRATLDQFENIVKKVQEANIHCVFAYDRKQYLADNELIREIPQKIESLPTIAVFRLTNKIRTNKEIASFIRQLRNKNACYEKYDYSHVKVIFFENRKKAKKFLKSLREEHWRVPTYTPGKRKTFQYEDYLIRSEESVHAVIGQEFERVASVIDEHFGYDDDDGKLVNAAPGWYSLPQMLFQILTRTREDLYIVIINNVVMLSRCLEIIHG